MPNNETYRLRRFAGGGGCKQEVDSITYGLTAHEAAFLRAYRRLPQTEQGYIDGIVPGWEELTEFARRNALEWQKRQGEEDKQK